MSIFTPPTDNLYKFMALSGIVLMVAFIVPLAFFHQTGMEYLAQLRGSKELQVHEEFTNQRLETLKLREQQAIDRKKKLQKRLEGMNAGSNSTEVDKLEGLIREANREIESIADSSHDLSLNLALKRAQVNSEETVSFNRRRDSRVAIQVGAIAVLLGFVASLVGFWLWYKKLQRFQDRVVAKEAEDKLAPAAANKQIEQAPPPANPGNSLEPVK
jgi:hypothetical protein